MLQTNKGHSSHDAMTPYQPFTRTKPSYDAVSLMETFGFRAVSQPLTYSREQRQDWANTMYQTCSDIASLWDIPQRAIGGYGRLALGMPPTNPQPAPAVYHTRMRAITAGLSSVDFARAWIMAWDHALGDMARQPADGRTPFPHDSAESPLLSASLAYYCRSGYRGHERFHILTPALLRERLQKAPESPHQPEWVRDWMRTVVALRWKSTAGQIRQTEYFVASQKAEGRKIQPYWSAPEEMMARALSFWMAHKAQKNGVRNSLLTETMISMPRPLAPTARSAIEKGLKAILPVLDQQGDVLIANLKRWSDLMETARLPQAETKDWLADQAVEIADSEDNRPH